MTVYRISVHKLIATEKKAIDADFPNDFELIELLEVERPAELEPGKTVFHLCREIEADIAAKSEAATEDDFSLFARAITADLIRWKRDHFWPADTAQTFGELSFVQSWNPPIVGIPFVCSVTDLGIPVLTENIRVMMRKALETLEATR
jgi:hypothetical protein